MAAPSVTLLLLAIAGPGSTSRGQGGDRPSLRAATLSSDIRLDGLLDEPAWATADSISGLTVIEPIEGAAPAGKTVVRVLANTRAIVIGIECYDPNPSGLVSYSKARDADLGSEDHVKLVLDTFLDGRSGYVFAVNPGGARYDALVANQGEGEAKGGTPHGKRRRRGEPGAGRSRFGFRSRA